MAKAYDGTCRGGDLGKIIDYLQRRGASDNLGAVALAIGRSVRYVHSICREATELQLEDDGGLVSDKRVMRRIRCVRCGGTGAVCEECGQGDPDCRCGDADFECCELCDGSGYSLGDQT